MNPHLVLHNAEIVTMDESNSIFDAIAVTNGKITSIGTNEEILRLAGSDTTVIDLEGKTVVPGFIDAHQHMFHYGFNLLYVDCRLSSIEEMVSAIKERARNSEPHEWVIGWGYDEANFKEQRKPNKRDFEGIENPVYISRYCGHAAAVNEKALSLAGITEGTTVKNGIIEKDAKGEITGILVEHAKDLVREVMPARTVSQRKEAVKLANEAYLKDGITSVHEAGIGLSDDALIQFDVLKEMDEAGELDVRLYVMIYEEAFDHFLQRYSLDEYRSDRINIGTLKLFADGTLSGKTAAASRDFRNSPGNKGMLLHTFDELEAKVLKAHERGLQVSIHAIGDRAVKQVLDVYEKVLTDHPRDDHRHRIEHATMTDEALLQRMKALGVIPVPQPLFVHLNGDVYMDNLDSPAKDYVIVNKKFVDYGLRPAGSSDCPVVPSSPLLGIYSAMSRETIRGNVIQPEERLSLHEALRMYTVNAARAAFEENVKGTLEEGKLADMVVLPPHFLQFSPEQIKNTEVEMTIVSGEIAYSKNS